MPVEPISANVVRVHLPDPLMIAVRAATQREAQTVSAYIRRALISELRAAKLYPSDIANGAAPRV